MTKIYPTASCERYGEEYKRDGAKEYHRKARESRRAEVRNFTLFAIDIIFDNLDDALAARRELVAAGFEFEIFEEVDAYSRAIFTEVRRSSCAGLNEKAIWKQVEEIVDPFGGHVDNGGLIEDLLKEQRLHRLH
jgi:hypothetical protein